MSLRRNVLTDQILFRPTNKHIKLRRIKSKNFLLGTFEDVLKYGQSVVFGHGPYMVVHDSDAEFKKNSIGSPNTCCQNFVLRHSQNIGKIEKNI